MYDAMDDTQKHFHLVIKPQRFIRAVCKKYNIPKEYFGNELDYRTLIIMYYNYCEKHDIKYRKRCMRFPSPRNRTELSIKMLQINRNRR